jgi:DNA invertase Pin-like site-specific DNA recombinase
VNTQTLVLGYVRVSTDRQDLSVEAQQAAVQRAANYQFGDGTEVELFAEPDTSGSLPFAEREQGRRLLDRVRLNALACSQFLSSTTLIVPKVDRLGRDTIDVSTTVKLLESLGARVMFLDINVDTRTPMGRAFMQIAAVFAELELSRIRERIQTALDHKRGAGLVTGTVPFGWNAVETGETNAKGVKVRRLEPNPEEQKWILHMAALKTQGWSYNKIAADLNRRGVPTKRAGELLRLKSAAASSLRAASGQWQFGQVARILTSRTVLDWLNQQANQQLAA